MTTGGKSEHFAQHLPDAIRKSLEELVFMEVNFSDTDIPLKRCDERICASLAVESPYQGDVILLISFPLLRQVARMIYPGGSRIDDDLLKDIAGELLNIIAGNLMGVTTAENETFRLGFPRQTDESAFWDVDQRVVFEMADCAGGVAATMRA